MAQAHFLPQLTPATENQYTSLLREALLTNAHLVMALPTFTSDVNPPSVAHLLGKYPTPDQLYHTGNSAAVETSKDDISNMLTNHDLQYQMWQKQQQEQSNISSWGVAESNSSSKQMSIDDAFGDLQEVEDLPLPSLQYTVPEEEKQSIVENEVDEDEFGDFDAVRSGEPAIANDGVNGFDGEPLIIQTQGSVVTATEGPRNEAVEAFEIPDDDNDEFNDFDSAPEIVDSTNTTVHETAIESITAPINGTLNMFLGNQEITSDENLNEAVDNSLPQPSNHGHTLSITDAFESLVTDQGSSPDPFNNTNQQASDLGNTQHISMAKTDESVLVDEDDEFGGFESTQIQSVLTKASTPDHDDPVESINLSHPSHHGPTLSISDTLEPSVINQESSNTLVTNSDFNGNAFGDSEVSNGVGTHWHHDHGIMTNHSIKASHEVSTATHGTHAPTLSISDAFDALVPDQDLIFSSGGENEQAQATDAENDIVDDEFGGFEGPNIQSDVSQPSNSDHDFHNKNIHSLNLSTNDQSSVPNQSISTSSIGQTFENNTMNTNTDLMGDAFADVEESNDVEVPVHDKDHHSEQAFEDSDKNIGAEIPPIQSSLHTWNETPTPIAIDNADNADNAEITIVDQAEKRKSEQDTSSTVTFHPTNSTFENTEFNTNTLGNEVGGLSALDDIFGGIQDAPLPPLEAFSPTIDHGVKQVTEEPESNGSFGEFEGNALSTEEIQTDDNVVSTNDPELNGFPQVPPNILTDIVEDNAMNQADESFGDFEAPSITLEQTTAETDRTKDTIEATNHFSDDDFGSFTAFDQAVPQPDCIPQHDDAFNQMDESFGDFEAPSATLEQTAAGGINPTENLAVVTDHISDNDFGGFTAFDHALPQPDYILQHDDAFNETDESFGDFEAPSTTLGQTTADTDRTKDIVEATIHVSNDDDFGGFSVFEEAAPQPDCIPQHDDAPNQMDESFGDFEAPSTTLGQTTPETNRTENVHVSNGDFEGFTAFAQAETQPDCIPQQDDAFNEMDESFGDFEAPSTTLEQTSADTDRTKDVVETTDHVSNDDDNLIVSEETEQQGQDTDDFDNFAAFQYQETNNDITLHVTQKDDVVATQDVSIIASNENNVEAVEDDFGDFEAFSTNEDDFGDFEAFSTNNENNDNTSAEFGDFSELDSAPPLMELREKICVLIQRLPPSLPPKDTLLECFDICSRRNEVRLSLALRASFICCSNSFTFEHMHVRHPKSN